MQKKYVGLRSFGAVVLGSVLLSMPAKADFLYGVYAEVGILGSDSQSTIDSSLSSSDLVSSKESVISPFANIKVEHPIPFVPNLRLYADKMSLEGQVVKIGDLPSQYNLDTTEQVGTLYYEILDNYIELDAGISLRKIQTDVDSNGGPYTVVDSFSTTMPTLFASASIAIPTTPFSVGAQFEGASYDDNDYNNVQVFAAYEMVDFIVGDLTFKVGLSDKDVSLDSDNAYEIEFSQKSVFSSVQIHF